jgi:hypothetical protein
MEEFVFGVAGFVCVDCGEVRVEMSVGVGSAGADLQELSVLTSDTAIHNRSWFL